MAPYIWHQFSTGYATPPLRLLTEEEARFRSLEAVANGAPVEQKDQCLGGWWMGRETPWKINGWNLKMEVWKIIFLSKWVICRFHVNLPGWRCWESIPCLGSLGRDPFLGRLFREGLSHGELHLRMLGWIGHPAPSAPSAGGEGLWRVLWTAYASSTWD